ncbi:MAG: hypothetical protein WBP79_10080 [Candidatus Acidiferrales bacterium]
MKLLSIRSGIGILALGLGIAVALAPSSFAQGYGGGGAQQGTQQQPAANKPPAPAAQPAAADAPKVDPAEEAAYKTFYDTNPQDTDKVIQLGEQFLKTYPDSKRYPPAVYSRLTQAYFDKQAYDKMYAAGDRALALNPDDVMVLTMIGWVIPHNYNPNDLESDRRLNNAEAYEKHALQVLATLEKPANLTDEQFAKVKAEAQGRAHSGLGLVYFRRNQYAESVAELQLARQLDPQPDAVDYFVMGIELEKLKKYADSADAYQKCAQIPSGLADRCKQSADQAKKLAASQPAPPK